MLPQSNMPGPQSYLMHLCLPSPEPGAHLREGYTYETRVLGLTDVGSPFVVYAQIY